jgi:DNA-damage-inducible protein D
MTAITRAAGSPFDRIKQTRPDGSEFWSLRKMQGLMGYARWENLSPVIARAMQAASNTGMDVTSEFLRSQDSPAGGGRPREDFQVTRQAAYLVAMNGDPNKPEVASAQAYFAARTIQAEQVERELTRLELIELARDAEVGRLEAEAKLAIAAPKADYVDSFVKGDEDATTLRVVANQLQVGEQALRQFLLERKAIYQKLEGRRWSRSKGRQVAEYSWHAYASHKAWFVERDQPEAPRYHNGQVRTTLYVTPIGKVKIAALLVAAA